MIGETLVVAEIVTGLGVFKSMMDVAKGLKDINDATVRNSVVIDLQEKILSAQAQQMTLLERVSQLERQIADSQAWASEKARYQLQELPPGVFVFVLKSDMANGEPEHRLCATCFNNGKKSILQSFGQDQGLETILCPICKTDLTVGHFVPSTQFSYSDD
jgi:hypothetical protein